MLEALDLSLLLFCIIIATAFLSGVLHGVTGMAGGIVMAAVLANIIGIKLAIPVMTCALIFSHGSRVYLHFNNADWAVCKRVLLFGLPTIVLGSVIFTYLDAQAVAIIMSVFLIASFPIKRYARKKQLKTSPKLLAVASSVWGVLAGNVIGPGFFLAPFLLGTGMNRLTFVGTLASITLVMNVVKMTVFSSTQLLDQTLILLGVFIGLATIPGNWVGKQILNKISDRNHAASVDILTVLIIINFLYLAFNS